MKTRKILKLTAAAILALTPLALFALGVLPLGFGLLAVSVACTTLIVSL